MTIIADSGSTKTDWCLCEEGRVVATIQTQGINPFHQTEETIRQILRDELCSPVFSDALIGGEKNIGFFYGSGCTEAKAPWLRLLLNDELAAYGVTFDVYNDLLGAARALFGRTEGIACILGTGANSCLYDGNGIVANTPPLGYILGDEGSGAVLGRSFLNGIFKGWLSPDLRNDFLAWAGLDYAGVIERVYRQPMANRFLASIVPFIGKYVNEKSELEMMVVENFRSFFRLNISAYMRKDLSVSFIGGVANAFESQLRKAADIEQYRIGTIEKSPIEGLINYHFK